MKIFLLTDYMLAKSDDYSFSTILINGTYLHENICKKCGLYKPGLPMIEEPILFEWRDTKPVVGDFNWSFYNIFVKKSVYDFLLANNYEVDLIEAQIEKPKRISKKYEAVYNDLYYYIQPQKYVSVDLHKSDITLSSTCKTCGKIIYNFKFNGLKIPKSEWSGEKLVAIKQWGDFSKIIYVTEEGLDLLKRQNYSNFGYMEAGEII